MVIDLNIGSVFKNGKLLRKNKNTIILLYKYIYIIHYSVFCKYYIAEGNEQSDVHSF